MTGTSSPPSTIMVPETGPIPKHIAIIMDGNGRWAKKRLLPRVAGHKRGVDAVRACVRACVERDVKFLTLFAFSSENWRRPAEEVSLLMKLFLNVLESDVEKLHRQNIRLKIIGDISAFNEQLQLLISQAQDITAGNTGLTLTIAANYGGRWDILDAMRKTLIQHPELTTHPELLKEELVSKNLSMAYAPEPDLFIRTGGEQRISNFVLWQLAYTELYFTDKFWPDFGGLGLADAIASYQNRERRFGRTSEQVQNHETFPSFLTGSTKQC
ncbi:MAG: polyprenyl diphosphate synthase [Burkholderiales bacterium]|nr:polyprenyl diphosphate synthase [Burkholderiales bacterium]